jgi:hypothetical protein
MYAYTPTVMDDGIYKIWFCSPAMTSYTDGSQAWGDHIFYSESTSLDGGWSTPVPVFGPTGGPNVPLVGHNLSAFDRAHTCDPSVIRVHGIYYLYYGGNWSKGPTESPIDRTAIGVASSLDGKNWTRLNNGLAIVRAVTDLDGTYGAGQPSVFYHEGKFYMLYTDESYPSPEPPYSWNKGHALRSPDPTFQSDLEHLAPGNIWVASNGGDGSVLALWTGAASFEWRYDDMLQGAMVAFPSTDRIRMVLVDLNLNGKGPSVDVLGHPVEGVGLVHRPDGHAPPAYGPYYTCGSIPYDVFYPVGTIRQPGTYRLAHAGGDWSGNCTSAWNTNVLEGSRVYKAGSPVALVRDGWALWFASDLTSRRFARAAYMLTPYDFDAIPFAGAINPSTYAMAAPDRPRAFVADATGLRWNVNCSDAFTDNGSTLNMLTNAQWDSIGAPSYRDLFCLFP